MLMVDSLAMEEFITPVMISNKSGTCKVTLGHNQIWSDEWWVGSYNIKNQRLQNWTDVSLPYMYTSRQSLRPSHAAVYQHFQLHGPSQTQLRNPGK